MIYFGTIEKQLHCHNTHTVQIINIGEVEYSNCRPFVEFVVTCTDKLPNSKIKN